MKKIILEVLVTTLALGGAVVALAETDVRADVGANATVETSRPEPKGLLQRVKALAPTRTEVKKENSVEGQGGKVQATTTRKIENRFDKMTKRFEATIAREEAIMVKVVSRIEKIKAVGGRSTSLTTSKTDAAEKLVAEAKTHITEAKISYEAMKIVVAGISVNATATTTVVTKANMESMKKATKEIEKHLREAHKSLQKTIGILKGVSQLQNATSTKEN